MTERAKYWERVLVAWEASGLTQAEFCRRRGLKAVTFAWWKRQLMGSTGRGGGGCRPGGKANSRVRKSSFVEVSLPGGDALGLSTQQAGHGANPIEPGYEVALPCGASIRLPAGFDVDKASQLISTVARSC